MKTYDITWILVLMTMLLIAMYSFQIGQYYPLETTEPELED